MAGKSVSESYIVWAIVLTALLSAVYLGYVYTDAAYGITVPALILLGFALAVIDTSIGMGFGTLGSPLLLIAGFTSTVAVPAVLVAQLLSALVGSVFHRRYKHADVLNPKKRESKIAVAMVGLGMVGAVIGVLLAIKLPSMYVSTYIGLLVIVMGVVLISRPKTTFSWMKLYVLSAISGFNKAISGGGYGPVSTTGLMASGNEAKNSIGITVFSVAIINLVSIGAYLLTGSITGFYMIEAMSLGAVIGAVVGPRVTRRTQLGGKAYMLGVMAVILGAITIATTFVKV